jgi:HAD superfamily phosphoserine phosphatase-like hydrolase
MLRLLKNLSQETINENAKNYAEWLKGKWIMELKDLFMKYVDNGAKIVVISGGYEIYLKHFFAEFPEVIVFGTKIEFKNGKLTGMFDGKDCMFQEKVNILDRWIETSGQNMEKSVVFSDSISDLPLLKWANEGFVVSHKKEQNWAKMNNLKEIIWG